MASDPTHNPTAHLTDIPEPPRNTMPPDQVPMKAADEPEHWLVKPATVRMLWMLFAGVLALTVLAQVLIPVKGKFGIDGWFGFNAVYGLLACAVMVVGAKMLGWVLKRPEDHYGDR